MTGWVEVEQGPRWLAELLYAPPEWLPRALVALVLVGGIGVVWLAARADIDADAVEEAATNLGVLAGAAGGTMLVMQLADLPYLGDVAIGFLIGIGVGYGVTPVAVREATKRLGGSSA